MNVRRYMEWLTEMAVPLIIFCVSQMVCTVIVGAVTMLMSGIQLSSWIDGNVSEDVTMRVMCMAMMLSSGMFIIWEVKSWLMRPSSYQSRNMDRNS